MVFLEKVWTTKNKSSFMLENDSGSINKIKGIYFT